MDATLFQSFAKDPMLWFEKAAALRACAYTLLQTREPLCTPLGSIDYMITAKMLYGMAMESALKGRIIQERPELVEFCEDSNEQGELAGVEIRRIGKGAGDGHNLVALWEATGISMGESKDELRDLLEDLTKCVRWLGRYPVPKRVASPDPSLGTTHLSYQGRSISQTIEPILDRLLPGDWGPV